jgi:hypothetical protein
MEACGNVDYGEKQLWWKSGNAEKPCFCLRFGAPYFYPDRRVTGAFTRKPTQKAAWLISGCLEILKIYLLTMFTYLFTL